MKTLLAAALLAVAALPALAPSARAADPAYHVVQRIPGPDGYWDYVSFDPVKRRVYVSHGDRIMVIEADTGKVDPHFADASRGHAVLPLEGGKELLTTNSGDNTARFYDTTSGKLLASVPTANDADGAAYDPFSKHVFVVDGDAGELTVIDPVAKKAVGSVKVGSPLEFASPDGKGRLYVNGEDAGDVVVVDTSKNKVLKHYPLPGCMRPTGIAWMAPGVTISSCGNGVAAVLDAATGKSLASLKIGPGPDAVIPDPANHRVFIPSGRDGTLAILSIGPKGEVKLIATAQTQTGARTGALDLNSGRVYLPTAKFTAPPAPGQRPGFVSGSFEVLVMGP
jgi:DNA-binding beta-propeller fold protein YncE